MNPRAGLIGKATPAGPNQLDWASPGQKICFNYGPSPICASGGFGASKTFAFLLKVSVLADRYANSRWLIARRINKELMQTTMKTFFKIIPQAAWKFGGNRNMTDRYVRFNNGSEVSWTHLDDPEIEGILKGIELNGFFIDQAEEIEEEIFDILLPRIGRWDQAIVPDIELQRWDHYHPGQPWPWINPASGHPIPPSYAMLACNPDVQLHWIYRRFHPDSSEHYDAKIPEIDDVSGNPTGRFLSYFDLGYKLVTMPSLENKFLPKQNKQLLLQQDKSFRYRYVDGNWGIPEGQIHDVSKLSLISGTPVLVAHLVATCKLYLILDHGDSAPTCVLWVAVDSEDNIFVYREYYAPGLLISHHREAIYKLNRSLYPDDTDYLGESFVKKLADPAIFYKGQQKHGQHWSTADEYRDTKPPFSDRTSIVWQPANNDEMGTRNRINEYLRVDEHHIHPLTKLPGAPKLYLVVRSKEHRDGCYHTYRELVAQTREKIGTELGKPIYSDKRADKPDHSYDCVRYFFGDRVSKPTKADEEKTGGTRSFNSARSRIAEAHRQHMEELETRRVSPVAIGHSKYRRSRNW